MASTTRNEKKGVSLAKGPVALLVPDDDLGVLAEAVRLVLHDDDLRAQLADRGRTRLREFQPENALTRLRTALEALAAD